MVALAHGPGARVALGASGGLACGEAGQHIGRQGGAHGFKQNVVGNPVVLWFGLLCLALAGVERWRFRGAFFLRLWQITAMRKGEFGGMAQRVL